MAAYGYSYVPEKGFVGFDRDLDLGAWNEISLKKIDVTNRLYDGKFLMTVPRPVVWKLRITWGITDLRLVLGTASSEVLERFDGSWDRTQRRLSFAVSSAAEHPDPTWRQAAERVRSALLLGNGTAQTTLGYDEEVDFGIQQVKLASEDPLAADIKLLALNDHIAEIGKTTEELAGGLGRTPGQKRTGARSTRLREALATCTAIFNSVHDEIEWLLAHVAPGETHDQLVQLHAPLQALLDRYPPPAKASVPSEPPPSSPPAAS
jgi:hypothetical protein